MIPFTGFYKSKCDVQDVISYYLVVLVENSWKKIKMVSFILKISTF